MEEGTEKMVQSIGPIHPDSREAEFKHLKKGGYSVYVEIHVCMLSVWTRKELKI